MSNSSNSVFRLAKFVYQCINVRNIFYISFCCIVRQISFNINISSKISKRVRKVFTHFCTREFHSRSFLSIEPLNELSYPFHLTYNLSPFLLITFSILNSSLTSFLQFFFIKTSINWFTIYVTNNISPRNCIFNFANN